MSVKLWISSLNFCVRIYLLNFAQKIETLTII